MKLNFKDIINIQTIKQLSKFSLDKPIYNNNYLFHYLILLDNLIALKLTKFPIYIEDNDGYNGFHLAAKTNNYNILCYLIKKYPNYIYNKNSNNELFTVFLDSTILFKLLNKYNNLKWNYLLTNNIFKSLILNLKYKYLLQLNKLLNTNKLIINKNLSVELNLFNIIKNNTLLFTEKKILLDNFNIEQINIKNNNGEGLLIYAIYDIELFNYLIERGIDTYYFSMFKTINPTHIAIKYDILYNKKQYTSRLKISSKIYNDLNKDAENIAHLILKTRKFVNENLIEVNSKINTDLDLELLELCDTICWNQYDINKITPLELISTLDYNIYSVLFKNKKIMINTIIINNIKNDSWRDLFLSLPSYTKEIEHIDMNKYTHCTRFQSTFKDIALFFIYLNNTYSNITIPKHISYQLNNLNFINSFPFSDNIIAKEPIFPWIISIVSKSEYYIHPYLNNIINSIRYNNIHYAVVFLSLYNNEVLHANILIYDFNKMRIERFEPYGNSNLIDNYVDDILEEELTWNTGLQYIKPSQYLPYAGFQTISNENNDNNIKPGDFGGFCLAWCLWYLESKLINPYIDSKILVQKLISKLINLNINFTEYIRNYSSKINVFREAYLKQIKFNERCISNINISNENNIKLTHFIINYYSK